MRRCFLPVQLQWSVKSMALDKVPPLAIFSAYTLYTVEGSREGRKWFGLRLGFFSDAVAAKQVAQYVRSDFTSVAVVPVSSAGARARGFRRQKDRAEHERSGNSAPRGAAMTKSSSSMRRKRWSPRRFRRAAARRCEIAERAPRRPPPAARAAATRSKTLRGSVQADARKAPLSLEQTLEILGAGNLELDDGRGEIINESGVRHMQAWKSKRTRRFDGSWRV